MSPYPLTDFEKQKSCENEPRFNFVYSRNNLPKIKDGAYVINEYKSFGTQWIALYFVAFHDVTYLRSFEVEQVPKEIKTFKGNKNITNIDRI